MFTSESCKVKSVLRNESLHKDGYPLVLHEIKSFMCVFDEMERNFGMHMS